MNCYMWRIESEGIAHLMIITTCEYCLESAIITVQDLWCVEK